MMERFVDYLSDWKRRALLALSLGKRLNVRADILTKLSDCAGSAQGLGFAGLYRWMRTNGRKYTVDEVWNGLAELERKGLIESVLIPAKRGGLADKKAYFLTTSGLVKMFEFHVPEDGN